MSDATKIGDEQNKKTTTKTMMTKVTAQQQQQQPRQPTTAKTGSSSSLSFSSSSSSSLSFHCAGVSDIENQMSAIFLFVSNYRSHASNSRHFSSAPYGCSFAVTMAIALVAEKKQNRDPATHKTSSSCGAPPPSSSSSSTPLPPPS
ncbi:unnamed protein product [Caenorhabditis bovis]|uniref:Uncharacterized protein n=1 Tax=Caenorhabditis bovis TaxID=2654633 RepID=A0A8S1EVS3_9PELO|nr:unnamed protein product [Caenorhabditis bovis]